LDAADLDLDVDLGLVDDRAALGRDNLDGRPARAQERERAAGSNPGKEDQTGEHGPAPRTARRRPVLTGLIQRTHRKPTVGWTKSAGKPARANVLADSPGFSQDPPRMTRSPSAVGSLRPSPAL